MDSKVEPKESKTMTDEKPDMILRPEGTVDTVAIPTTAKDYIPDEPMIVLVARFSLPQGKLEMVKTRLTKMMPVLVELLSTEVEDPKTRRAEVEPPLVAKPEVRPVNAMQLLNSGPVAFKTEQLAEMLPRFKRALAESEREANQSCSEILKKAIKAIEDYQAK